MRLKDRAACGRVYYILSIPVGYVMARFSDVCGGFPLFLAWVVLHCTGKKQPETSVSAFGSPGNYKSTTVTE